MKSSELAPPTPPQPFLELLFHLPSVFCSYSLRMNNLYESQPPDPDSPSDPPPPAHTLRSHHYLISDVITLKNKTLCFLAGAALAPDPTRCSFQPVSDCLIGVCCCVCQGCWQHLALIYIKQEEAEISPLLCIPLPSLQLKEESARNSEEKIKHESALCSTGGSTLPLARFDTFFSSLFSPAWSDSYKSFTI